VALQEKQLVLEQESAKLAKLQLELLELGRGLPPTYTRIFQVTDHYKDGDMHDTAIEITIDNPSSVVRSINNCSVGLAEDAEDKYPRFAREAEFRDNLAEYPISIAAGSSVILYSFGRRLQPLYQQHFIGLVDPKPVLVRVDVAGIPEPLVRTVGTYSPNEGLHADSLR
jgi:hypothetical protein